MLSKVIIRLPMSLVADKGGGFALFRYFGVVSGSVQFLLGCSASFQFVLVCYSLFRVVPIFLKRLFHRIFRLSNLPKMNFKLDFIARASFIRSWSRDKCIANKGRCYKVEQFFLQIWGTITKGGTFYYKVGQLLQSTAVQEF